MGFDGKSLRIGPGYLLGVFKWLAILVVFTGVAGLAGVAGLYYHYGRDLPELIEGAEAGEPRHLIPIEDIPPFVQLAFLAANDSRFFHHDQVIPPTSNITHQLLRSISPEHEHVDGGRVRQLLRGYKMERILTREEILHLYLNTVYLGHGNHGVEEASLFYFGKSVTDIDLAEAALLAGLTSGPDANSPLHNLDGAMRRSSFVLRQMWELGFIDDETYEEASL